MSQTATKVPCKLKGTVATVGSPQTGPRGGWGRPRPDAAQANSQGPAQFLHAVQLLRPCPIAPRQLPGSWLENLEPSDAEAGGVKTVVREGKWYL